MSSEDNGFLRGRLKSLKYAVRGMWFLITTEHSIMVQIAIAVVITGAGWYFNISNTEWIVQILAIGLVLVAESLNTAIEKLCDFIHPDHDNRIGFIKDISAGAVTFAALVAIGIGLVIYLPRIINIS